ncbi:MAG: sigma-70 family RNA polymerase sigma factor [Planctomycetota bacterium]
MQYGAGDITKLLDAHRNGDGDAFEALLPLVYEELRALSHYIMAEQGRRHTLQPTALVNEACMRLMKQNGLPWNDRSHLIAVAATAMRQILMNHAREKRAAKRGGEWDRVTLDQADGRDAPSSEVDLIELDDALSKLAELSERQARIVELRFFGGLTIAQTADIMNIGTTTVEDDWALARAWLARELSACS